MPPSTLPTTFGPYLIQSKLGEGGMGAVYLAEDTRLGRKVALKIPHFSGGDDTHVVERFQREARLAAQIEHENLCPVYDVGCLDGVHFLAMKYLEGTPLSRYISPHNPWPPATAVTLVRHLCAPLHLLHSRGVIHRDLKPSNIMIVEGRKPVLLDFGLARSFTSHSQHLTATGAQMGTPLYMSPEQVAGDSALIGPTSDIYALGLILYELIVGQSPLAASTPLEIFARILYAPIPPPSQYRPGLLPVLDTICLTAVARNPAERYPSMAAFAQALDQFLRDPNASQVPAGPPVLRTPPPAHGALATMAGMPTMSQVCSRCYSPLALPPGATLPICPRCQPTPTPAYSHTQIQAGARATMAAPALVPTAPTRSFLLPVLAVVGCLALVAASVGGLFLSGLFDGHFTPTTTGTVENHDAFTNSIGMRLVPLRPGKVWIGSPAEEPEREEDEFQHEIELTRPLFMGAHEVTQKQYEQVMGKNPSWFQPGGGGADKINGLDHATLPVEYVSWQEAKDFCERLSSRSEEQQTGRHYRLPTEGEWEYACRAGQSGVLTRPFSLRTPLADLTSEQANFNGLYPGGKAATGPYLARTNPVGKYGIPNAFGLHDMHGNVWEWCSDWYAADTYRSGVNRDPQGPGEGEERVLRGGAWNSPGSACRAAARQRCAPDLRYRYHGFRVICELHDKR